MQKLVVVLSVIMGVVIHCNGYRMTECQVVRELRRNGFPENKLRDWLCLINNESGRQTHIISPFNSNRSRDWGLFQINDKYWCSTTNTPGKDCNVTCKNLITDNITRASTCAKKIYARHGFKAWYGWVNKCQKNLPALPRC